MSSPLPASADARPGPDSEATPPRSSTLKRTGEGEEQEEATAPSPLSSRRAVTPLPRLSLSPKRSGYYPAGGSHAPRRSRRSMAPLRREGAVRRRATAAAPSLRFAVLTLWALVTLTALTLGVVADVFQGERPQFPLVPVVSTSVCLDTVATALVLLLGKLSKHGYAIFQPFAGSPRFVLLQTGGYMLWLMTAVGLVVVSRTASVGEGPVAERYGAYTVLSTLAVAGQVLLVTSLLFFSASVRSATAEAAPPQWLGFLAQTPTREHAFVALCVAVMLTSAAAAEVYPLYRPVSVVLVTGFAVVALATVAHLGRLQVPTYRVVLPSPHGAALVCLQLLANSVLLLYACGSVVLHTAGSLSPASWHIGAALLGIVGVCCHLLLLRLTRARERQLAAADAALAALERDPNSPLLHLLAHESERRAEEHGSLYGAAMSTGVSVVLAGTVFGISLALSVRSRGRVEMGPHGGSGGGGAADYVATGLTQVQGLLVLLLFALPPFTHLQGRLAFGRGFAIWQPFRGSVDFVVLQAVGWAFYGFGILFTTLHLAESAGSFHFLLVLTTLLVLCQLFVHSSLLMFVEGKGDVFSSSPTDATAAGATAASAHASSPTAAALHASPSSGEWTAAARSDSPFPDGSASPVSRLSVSSPTHADATAAPAVSDEEAGVRLRSLVATVVNGEMLLALVLTVVAVLLRAVCDATMLSSAQSRVRAAIPTTALGHVATFFNLLAPPLAQLSMRDRVSLLRATSNSTSFSVLQVVAWLLYTALFFVSVVNAALGERQYLTCVKEYQPMEYTGQGVVLGLPLMCVLLSSLCEAQDRVQYDAATQRVVRAADALVEHLRLETCGVAERRRAVELIRAVAGPRLAAVAWGRALLTGVTDDPLRKDADTSGDETRATTDAAERERLREERGASISAARYITAITWLGTTAAFASAAFLVDAQPVITLLFGVAGLLVLSLSCVSLQLVLGRRLHGHTGRYPLFMPFQGGRAFVAWQALGWASYTIVVCLMIACVVEGRGSRLGFFVMGALGSVSEGAVLHSIPLFDAEHTMAGGFIGRNAEGLLTAIILLGTFAFARAYDLVAEGGGVSSSASALVPVIIVSIAMCLTIPMGLLYLQRQAELYGVSPFAFLTTAGEYSDSDDTEDELEADASLWEASRHVRTAPASRTLTPRLVPPGAAPMAGSTSAFASSPRGRQASTGSARDERMPRSASDYVAGSLWREPSSALGHPGGGFGRRRGWLASQSIAVSYAVSIIVALSVVLLLPFVVVIVAHAYARSARLTYAGATHALELLIVSFLAIVAVPMIVAPFVRHSRTARWVHSALCAWTIYSIPTITVVSGVSPPFFVNTHGSWLFAMNMCVMALLSTIPYVHLTAFVFSLACFGYFAQYHMYTCLYARREPFAVWECITDMACALFWLWYNRRYFGRPEITGRFQSDRVSHFFQKHFFEGMSHWFSLQIIVADLYTLPSEAGVIALVERAASPAKGAGAGAGSAMDSGAAADVPGLRSLTHRRHANRSDPGNQYIFAMHPHGIFPGTALYAPKTLRFEKALGANKQNFISTHCADVIFSVPLMREFPLSLGALSVSRAGIEHSIRAGNSPLIITGGQSEMLLSRVSSTEMRLVCHHLGFVKVAMRHRIPLVPLLSFSECNIMGNIHCLGVQRWFLKRIGFPFPTIPHGFMKLPLPTSTPMTLVIGPPLMPLPGRDNSEDAECQEELRVRYFEHVEYLFYRYRVAAGYPDMKLYLHYGVDDAGVLATPPAAQVAPEDYVLDERNSAIRRALAANRLNRERRAAAKAAAGEMRDKQQ